MRVIRLLLLIIIEKKGNKEEKICQNEVLTKNKKTHFKTLTFKKTHFQIRNPSKTIRINRPNANYHSLMRT